jgi:hypothetical protein
MRVAQDGTAHPCASSCRPSRPIRLLQYRRRGKGQSGWWGYPVRVDDWEYPGLYLTPEFHAVWADPSGTLIDITPKPDGERHILFAADMSYPPNFDFGQRPGSQRVRIYQPPARPELVQARISRFNDQQIEYERGRAAKKGLSLEQWVETKIPVDPLPDLVDAFVRDSNERDTLYVPSPNGYGRDCTNPHRVIEIDRRRFETQKRIQALYRLPKQQIAQSGQDRMAHSATASRSPRDTYE